MKYYKIIIDDKFIGVGTSYDLCRHQKKHNILLRCEESGAQYIQYKDNLYRDKWMLAKTSDDYVSINSSVIEIDEKEYNDLLSAIETGEEIEQLQEEADVIEIINEDPDITIEYVKDIKIKAMSIECNKVIENGFDIVLSNGKKSHFSIEISDQLKIQALAMKAKDGQSPLYWHADNEYCVFYSAEDILAIYQKMEQIETYQTTYFNSLKMYILSMDNIDDIKSVTYGVEIPVEYQSDVLKYLMQEQNG